MVSMAILEPALTAVLAGDLSHLSTVLAAEQVELKAAASGLPFLSISRSSLRRVIADWRSGAHRAADVQRWASFVRRGYVAGTRTGAVYPIDIEYEADREDVIAEIVSRLDEIGDLIDGCIGETEKIEMLRALAD
jgi:hypothetical protein